MENTELEKWVREQTERLGELRRLLCSSGKPELEQYLAQAVVQPFFYFRKNGNGNGGSRVTLALEKFVDEEKFKALSARMKQMDVRYAGERHSRDSDLTGWRSSRKPTAWWCASRRQRTAKHRSKHPGSE